MDMFWHFHTCHRWEVELLKNYLMANTQQTQHPTCQRRQAHAASNTRCSVRWPNVECPTGQNRWDLAAAKQAHPFVKVACWPVGDVCFAGDTAKGDISVILDQIHPNVPCHPAHVRCTGASWSSQKHMHYCNVICENCPQVAFDIFPPSVVCHDNCQHLLCLDLMVFSWKKLGKHLFWQR